MQMGCNVHDIQNKVVVLWYKKQEPKVVNIFWYDSKLW
jgi:hypothetical protein